MFHRHSLSKSIHVYVKPCIADCIEKPVRIVNQKEVERFSAANGLTVHRSIATTEVKLIAR